MISKLQTGAQAAVDAVSASQQLSTETVSQAGEANSSLSEIERLVSIIKDMNSQIARATEQQTSAADEVNLRINELSQSTEQSLQHQRLANRPRAYRLAHTWKVHRYQCVCISPSRFPKSRLEEAAQTRCR